MKKLFYILFAASAALFVSCAKEAADNTPSDPALTGKTITFSASIELNAETKAALSGLNINWEDGDYIGVATDNDATIRVYPVTVGAPATNCTVTVDEVAGATDYYAIFKGRLGDGGANVNNVEANDFSMISFNTTTKTFSGLTVGKQQVAQDALYSYLWYTNGYPLAMAGKADGTTLLMKPCLALMKLQIASASVPAGYFYQNIPYESSYSINHDHYYSAVRGFNLYQKGGSTIYSSGDYNVQVNDDGSLTTTAVVNEHKGEYRQMSQSGKLSSGTDYLMCLIPGGSISSFQIDFLGYSDNTPTISWDAVYSMTKSGSVTVNPGDYFDLGTLNPLGRKKAMNEAADEAADAAGPFTPAIEIDGDMDDWSSLESEKVVSISGAGDYLEFKVTYDLQYLYFYSRRNNARFSEWPFYVWYKIDTNNDGSYEKEFYFYPYSKPASELVFNSTPSSENISGLTLSCARAEGSEYEFETSVPRSELGISNGAVLKFQSTMNKVNSGATLTISSSSLTIDDD